MLMRFIPVVALIVGASFFVSCSSDEVELKPVLPQQGQGPVSKKGHSSADFKAPSASETISLEKAKLYVRATEGLLILASNWSSKIENAKDQEKLEVLGNYNEARERLCIQIGLMGFAEYNWLDSVAIKNPANAKTFESAGVKIP